MPQIFDVTANENARYKRNELEWEDAILRFFVDISFTNVLEIMDRCKCKRKEAKHVIYIALVKILLGSMCNLELISIIFFVNRDSNSTIFACILSYAVVFQLAAFTIMVCICFCDVMPSCRFSKIAPLTIRAEDKKETDDRLKEMKILKNKAYGRMAMVIYKCCEIPFDIMCLFYDLSFNDFVVTTDFGIAIMIITISDVVLNLVQLAIDIRRCCKDCFLCQDESNQYLCKACCCQYKMQTQKDLSNGEQLTRCIC